MFNATTRVSLCRTYTTVSPYSTYVISQPSAIYSVEIRFYHRVISALNRVINQELWSADMSRMLVAGRYHYSLTGLIVLSRCRWWLSQAVFKVSAIDAYL